MFSIFSFQVSCFTAGCDQTEAVPGPPPSSPQPPVPQPRKSSKTAPADPEMQEATQEAGTAEVSLAASDQPVPAVEATASQLAAADETTAFHPAAADEPDNDSSKAELEVVFDHVSDNGLDSSESGPAASGLSETAASAETTSAVAMGDIRSAFAFLDKESGREGSVEPMGSAAASIDDACIEVNLVRNRLSIFERLSRQAAGGGGPSLPRQPFPNRAARAKSEVRELRVASPVSCQSDPTTVVVVGQAAGRPSFSERVRKISEHEAAIYEGMARNAAEDHEAAREEGGSLYPQKTQVQENVINEYTRKHSSSSGGGGTEVGHEHPPVVAKIAPTPSAVANQPAFHAAAPVRTGYASNPPRVKTAHAQQSPTMESIQRSLGLSEADQQPAIQVEPAVTTAARSNSATRPELAARTETRQQPAAGRSGGTYNLQKSGFSVTLKSQRSHTSVPPNDPAARKQVYSQYRELLKKFSHHREETV